MKLTIAKIVFILHSMIVERITFMVAIVFHGFTHYITIKYMETFGVRSLNNTKYSQFFPAIPHFQIQHWAIAHVFHPIPRSIIPARSRILATLNVEAFSNMVIGLLQPARAFLFHVIRLGDAQRTFQIKSFGRSSSGKNRNHQNTALKNLFHKNVLAI